MFGTINESSIPMAAYPRYATAGQGRGGIPSVPVDWGEEVNVGMEFDGGT